MKKAVLISLFILTFSCSIAAAEGWILWEEFSDGSKSIWKIISALPSYQECIAIAKYNAKFIANSYKVGFETKEGEQVEMIDLFDNRVIIRWKSKLGMPRYEDTCFKCFPPNFDPRK